MKNLCGRKVAVKISKNKRDDIENAHAELGFLKQLKAGMEHAVDDEGKAQIIEYLDSFKFRKHIIIIFEILHWNLYKFMKNNIHKDPIFDPTVLRTITF